MFNIFKKRNKISVISSYYGKINNNANGIVIENRVYGLSNFCDYKINNIYTFDDNIISSNLNVVKISKEKYFKTNIKEIKYFLYYYAFYNDKSDIFISYVHEYMFIHLAMAKKILFNKKWIVFFSDPCMEISPFLKYLSAEKNGLYGKNETLLALKYADLIVFQDKQQKNYILNEMNFKDCNRFKILQIPIPIINLNNEVIVKNKNEILFYYIGDLYDKRNLNEFIIAFDELTKEKDYKNCILKIYGNNENPILKMKNIKEYGPVSMDKSNQLMQKADFLVATEAEFNDINEYPYTTSKILNYIPSKKPVILIANKNSPGRDIINDVNGYVSDFSKKEIKKVIKMAIKEKDNFKYNKEAVDKLTLKNSSLLLDKMIKSCENRNLRKIKNDIMLKSYIEEIDKS